MYSTTGATRHLFFLKLVIGHPLQSEKTGCHCRTLSVWQLWTLWQRLGFILINPGTETLNWHEQECIQLKVHSGQDQDVILSSSPSQEDKGSLRTGDLPSANCPPAGQLSTSWVLESPWRVPRLSMWLLEKCDFMLFLQK